MKSSADNGGGGVDVLVVGAGSAEVEAAAPVVEAWSVCVGDPFDELPLPEQPAASPAAASRAAIPQPVDLLMSIGMSSLPLGLSQSSLTEAGKASAIRTMRT
ncbi:hypothetical protein GCM10009839_68790 [Catenulispora yoronensis]|uniref:Uncharacterized protein n=1 Tax=Catenulispora yoronensis TaxID=450799 RepID=A0ABP5GTL6_9ACTN